MPEFLPQDIGMVAQRELARTVVAAGSLQAARSATVRAKLAAEVREVRVREGENVSKGQVLAVLDASEQQERVRSAEGQLASAQARASNAQTTRDAQKRLLDQNFISPSAFDNYESTHKAAQGDLAAARSQAALVRQTLVDAQVRAPMSGVVAKRHVNPGEKLGFDAPLVHIVDLSSLELQAFAPPEAAGSVRVGSPVKVQVGGFAQSIDGRVVRVMPQVDASSRQLGLVVALSPTSAELKAGLDATARIRVEPRQVLTAPIGALQTSSGEPALWLLEGTKITKKKVTLGTRDEDLGVAEVTGGASAGQKVLIGRYDGLRDGQTVKLLSTAPTSAPLATAASAPASATK